MPTIFHHSQFKTGCTSGIVHCKFTAFTTAEQEKNGQFAELIKKIKILAYRQNEISQDACETSFEAVPTPANLEVDSQSSTHQRGGEEQVILI